jgi:hypothetical protein
MLFCLPGPTAPVQTRRHTNVRRRSAGRRVLNVKS